jgi:predicted GNAT family acetyltransferase
MKRTDKLDHTLEESFPASDPPANTVVTGARVGRTGGPFGDLVVRDNPESSRLEADVNGQLATLRYERHPHAVVLVETHVPAPLRGRGVANAMARWAIETAERDGLRVVAVCPFVRAYIRRHARHRDIGSSLTN